MPTHFDRLSTGFDTPAVRATQGERPFTKLVTTPFVLSALRSKAYRSMSGVATEENRINKRWCEVREGTRFLRMNLKHVAALLPSPASGGGSNRHQAHGVQFWRKSWRLWFLRVTFQGRQRALIILSAWLTQHLENWHDTFSA